MLAKTQKLWTEQDRHPGDRHRLFAAVADAIDATSALYPGSFVDVSPSFVLPEVVYVDTDKRANAFFADESGVLELIEENGGPPDPSVTFLHADYQEPLKLPKKKRFDLLISMYAGFVSEHCTDRLEVGGTLLVHPSHGDVAMASIDERYVLAGVVTARQSVYRVERTNLDSYLWPRKPVELTVDMLHDLGKGVGYTKSPFAYLFERIG
jgi:hypothetical protein